MTLDCMSIRTPEQIHGFYSGTYKLREKMFLEKIDNQYINWFLELFGILSSEEPEFEYGIILSEYHILNERLNSKIRGAKQHKASLQNVFANTRIGETPEERLAQYNNKCNNPNLRDEIKAVKAKIHLYETIREGAGIAFQLLTYCK